jgi:L-asparaginase
VAEGRVELAPGAGAGRAGAAGASAPSPQRPALRPERLDFAVPIVPTFLGDDGALLRAALDLRPDALVLVALGAGHVPPPVLAALRETRVPVAVTVRPERGALLRAMYGFEGAEGDVRATGAIPAATLSPQAARMRMLAALGAGLTGDDLAPAVGERA